jgi:hypothetical protein
MFLLKMIISVSLLSFSSWVSAAPAAPVPVELKKTILDKIAIPPLSQMPDLSLRLLQQHQPPLSADNTSNWIEWERKRYQLMMQLGQWQELLARYTETEPLRLQTDLPLSDRYWLSTQRIQAWIELQEYQQALSALRQSLWQADATTDVILIWRQQLIHVYLGMDNIDDAERAMRRYREDYADRSRETVSWKILQAQLLMRVDRPLEANELIKHIMQSKAVALSFLARMQAQLLTPTAVRTAIQKILAKPDLKEEHRVLYLYVLYRVAVAELDLPGQIDALEQLLVNPARQNLGELFIASRNEITADQLWRCYEQYGMQIANQRQLLQGDDAAWMLMAEKSPDNEAKSLNAVLALQSQQTKTQQQAILQMSVLLEKQAEGLEILRTLFLRSTRLAVDAIPLVLRYKFIDYALSRGDLQSAARLLEALKQPPRGQDAYGWNLRRARVLILSGQFESGAVILTELPKTLALNDEQIDQYLQVVFDLQAIQQHDLALSAFMAIDAQNLSAKNRRELAYWKAESLQKLGRYEQAALLYLESAPAADGSYDPWYHTASFQAAEAMAEAGLLDDARRQYIALLDITTDLARQVVIRQKLQDLRLLNTAAEQKKAAR